MGPTQRKVAAKYMLELCTAEVDTVSVGSDTSLSAACGCCNSWDSFSSRINFRRHSLSWGEGQGLGRRHEVTELLRHNYWAPSAMLSNSSQTGKTSKISETFVLRMTKADCAWVRCIRTVRPRFKRARRENVVIVWPWFSRSEKIIWLKSAWF